MEERKEVSILGTTYFVDVKDKEEDELLKNNRDGYCDTSTKYIVVENMKPEEGTKRNLKAYQESVLRHELVHAFFYESGLDNYSSDEQLVDYLAIQIPKIYKAMKEIDCI